MAIYKNAIKLTALRFQRGRHHKSLGIPSGGGGGWGVGGVGACKDLTDQARGVVVGHQQVWHGEERGHARNA